MWRGNTVMLPGRREISMKETASAAGAGSLAQKRYLELSAPSLEDTAGDWARLERALVPDFGGRPLCPSLEVLRGLGQVLRESGWRVTATVADDGDVLRATRVESGNTTGRNFGLAVDVGTTTIAVELIDLNGGRVLGSRTGYNGQIRFGTDVTARMIHAEHPGGLADLHDAVVATLNTLVGELAAEHGVGKDEIDAVACAGNAIMAHLLYRLDPSTIRREPYVPATTVFPLVPARDLGLDLGGHCVLYFLPAASGYVGSDITAGLLSTGIAEEPALSLLVDIGTNGETVLGNQDWLVACSGSAGAAFEGCGLEWGMPATAGAVERVWIEGGRLRYRTVEDAPPRGICGSGLIDALAELPETGAIDRSGRIDLGSGLPWVRRGEHGPEVVLVPAEATPVGRDLVLTQGNVENLMRDKAALYAGSRILLSSVGLGFGDVERILIAGGFGRSLDIERAVAIGLLPDVPRERIRFIGNSSLAGARLALLSGERRRQAEAVAARVTCLELTRETRYFDEYVAALFLPHTNADLFPSVRERLASLGHGGVQLETGS